MPGASWFTTFRRVIAMLVLAGVDGGEEEEEEEEAGALRRGEVEHLALSPGTSNFWNFVPSCLNDRHRHEIILLTAPAIRESKRYDRNTKLGSISSAAPGGGTRRM
jgi:hypothetical protein